MDRSEYAYAPLSPSQYEAIITASEMAGNVSPMHGEANWRAAESTARADNVDLRVLLAGTLFEDHDGTDPDGGIALAKVYNFGGIKWAGQPGAFDSGIEFPRSEGIGPMGTYTYAGFNDLGGFVRELIATLNNQYCGPYFTTGDLANAWSVYIRGRPNSGVGQERVDQWQYYRTHYPPEGATNVDGVYGEDLIAKLQTQIGHPTSGDYDPRNGDHPWAYYCEAGVESTGRNCGLDITARASAIAKYNACLAQGLIQQGTPEHGAQVFFGTAFFSPDGHTGLWDAERGQLLGTLTDGTGVGYRNWGPGTVGYLGWCRIPGVVGEHRGAVVPVDPAEPSHPIMAGTWVPAGNPNETGTDPEHRLGFGGGNMALVQAAGAYWLQTWGWPIRNEQPVRVTDADGTVTQRIGQECERNWILYSPDANPEQWRSVGRLLTQKVETL